jgi:hypothetical protein
MAVVSGYTITPAQAAALVEYDGDKLNITEWKDGSITIDNGDEVIIEFVLEKPL